MIRSGAACRSAAPHPILGITLPAPFEILPADLIATARRMRRQAFIELVHGAPLLVIGLAEQEPALLQGLEASQWRDGGPVPPSPDGLPFATATVNSGASPSATIHARARGGPVYAALLQKRPGAQTMSEHRIRIGRSHSNDIVLRDPSVSKLHAWFERDDEGRYYVSDAGSHNGTRVDGSAIPPRRATPLFSGVALVFGRVEATYLSAAELWEAL